MITRRDILVAASEAVLLASGAVPAAATSTRLEMEIKRIGSEPPRKAPVEYFTGAVRIDSLFQAPEPRAPVRAA